MSDALEAARLMIEKARRLVKINDKIKARGEVSPIWEIAEMSALLSVAAERDAMAEAIREVLANKTATFKARNGREVGIQDDNGEKCWIVPHEPMGALEAALSTAPRDGWRTMDDPELARMKAAETTSFLVLLPKNAVADYVVLQVSWFEGRMYPDARDACIDWEDGITTATHWQPLPSPPHSTKETT